MYIHIICIKNIFKYTHIQKSHTKQTKKRTDIVEDKCQHKMLYALKNLSLFPLVYIDVKMNIVYIFSVKKTEKIKQSSVYYYSRLFGLHS